MSGVVWSPVQITSGDLYVLTSEHRLYVARSRDGSYLHVISPSRVDALDANGEIVRAAGFLTCTCKGAIFQGKCYRLQEAIELERQMADQAEMPVWKGELASETELEKAAARG